MLKQSLFVLFVIIGTSMRPAHSAVPIYVAAYEMPPYFSSSMETHIVGELVSYLNKQQSQYQFRLKEIRAPQRYKHLAGNDCCDVLFFESPEWGWEEGAHGYDWGQPLTQGEYRYYVLKSSFADTLNNQMPQGFRCVGGVFGYHYKYTEKQTAPEELEHDFNFYTTNSSMSVLNMLLGKRIDMAILGNDYLDWLRHQGYPEIEKVVSYEVYDHTFVTQSIVNRASMLPVSELDSLISEAKQNGAFQEILARFGIDHLAVNNE